MTLSYSALKSFSNCPRQYHEVRVLKKHPPQETEYTIWGKTVHEAAELYIRDGKPFEFEFPGSDVVEALAALRGEKFCELELAVNDKLEPVEFDDPSAVLRGIADLVILKGEKIHVCDYKGLALDTKLPTPTGWTTMGAVQIGDVLFSESGEPCTVTGKSGVKHLRCYQVTFENTATVICDEEHLWRLLGGQVVGVTELRGKKHTSYRPNGAAHIALASPLELPEISLPIDPYVLGLWLADGKHTSGEISKPDAFIWEEIQRRGYLVDMATGGKNSCPTRTVGGLRAQLKQLGLLGNKHVPPAYMRAGFTQRVDLLHGLMDGDGSANPTRKQAVFMNTDKALSEAVRELLCSLGQRPLMSTTKQFGFDRHVTAYPISFRPIGINPFLLPRKRDRILSSWGGGQSWYHTVSKVEEVSPVATQCIAVDSKDRTFLCTEHMIPTHNTGKDKYPDVAQLELMALLLFAKYPEVKKSHGALLFLAHDTIVQNITKKEDEKRLWAKWFSSINMVEQAHETGVWNAKPSGLCPWCPCTTCEHWKPKPKGR